MQNVTPVVLCSDTNRYSADKLPTKTGLNLCNVSISLIVVHYTTDSTPNILTLLECVHLVTNTAIRCKAQTKTI